MTAVGLGAIVVFYLGRRVDRFIRALGKRLQESTPDGLMPEQWQRIVGKPDDTILSPLSMDDPGSMLGCVERCSHHGFARGRTLTAP